MYIKVIEGRYLLMYVPGNCSNLEVSTLWVYQPVYLLGSG